MSFDWQQWTDVQFWLELKEQLQAFGLLLPFLLAYVESFLPVLPLFGIVLFNVTVHGHWLGFFLSLLGNVLGSVTVFMFFRLLIRPSILRYADRHQRIQRSLLWVSKQRPSVIFYLAALPFTPSSLLNMFFGCSDYSKRSYILSITGGKIIMISMMAFFGYSVTEISDSPWFFIISLAGLLIVYLISKWANKRTGINDL